jgi:hypothetical protein
LRFKHSLKTAWTVPFILVALILLVPFSSKLVAANEDNNEQIVILYDLGHGQFFNQSLLSKALDYLENDPACDCNFEIRYSYGDFNSSILSGVDILLMTNPGAENSLNDPQGTSGRNNQQYAIAQWFLQGKSIFLLSNPFDKVNVSLSGHPDSLLRVIRSDYLQVGGVDMRANYLAQNSSDVTNGKARMSEFSNINVSISPILRNPHNVSTIITKSATVRASIEGTSNGLELIKGNLTSFAVAEDGKVEEVEREPNIFATIDYVPTEDDYEIVKSEVAGAGRIALSGSTLMFSDLPTFPGSTDLWIDLGDNKNLWINTILWLAGKTQAEMPTVIDDEEFSSLVTFGILGVSAFGLLILGTVAHYYGSSKPLEPLEKIKKDEAPKERKKKRQLGAKKPRSQIRRKKK